MSTQELGNAWRLITARIKPKQDTSGEMIELTVEDVDVIRKNYTLMNDRYYTRVSRALERMFPNTYNSISADEIDEYVLNKVRVSFHEGIAVHILLSELEREDEMKVIAYHRLIQELYKSMDELQDQLHHLHRVAEHARFNYEGRDVSKGAYTCL